MFFLVINVIPPKKTIEKNPFIKKEGALPMIAAHRGGGVSNPENTLMAYRAAVNEFHVQVCETDVWMTSDGHLVCNHDSNINRMACEEGTPDVIIADHTLEELKSYNMGYNFRDPATGKYPYRDISKDKQQNMGLKIVEFRELLDEFYDTNKDLLFIVEIKDGDETGYHAVDIIEKELTELPNYRDNIVIGTFHPDIEKYMRTNHPNILRGASTAGATEFIITQLMHVNLFSRTDFTCLQIPITYDIGRIRLDLTWKTFINRAHRRNIAIQYWTINNEDEMRMLIEKGVDAIITDDPKLLMKVEEEYAEK